VLWGSVLTVFHDEIEVHFKMVSQVGDFGLARWQPDGDMGVETRVIGTFGYAIRYAHSHAWSGVACNFGKSELLAFTAQLSGT
jgi:hypothetical protein